MKYLAPEEAKHYLQKVGMTVGEWNQLRSDAKGSHGASHWINHRAPAQAIEMYRFASHVASWLPAGEWKIFQIDNSTSLQEDEAFLMERLLGVSSNSLGIANGNTILFEPNNTDASNLQTEWLLSSLVFLFLLFEGHGQVVSSGCQNGRHLSIQDGFVYFISDNDEDIAAAKSLIDRFKQQPPSVPA